MPDMPSWIAKGSILMALDNANQNTLGNILTDLNASRNSDVAAIARTHLGISQPAEDHLRNDWFSDTGYWNRNVEDEIRHGFISALTAYNLGEQGVPKKLECYWMCCCSAPETPIKFMFHNIGPCMIIIIRTGEPDLTGSPARPPLNNDEPFWVIDGMGQPEHPRYAPI